MGELATASEHIVQALDLHSVHWRIWVLLGACLLLVCFCCVTICSCCAGFMLGTAANSNLAQVIKRAVSLSLWGVAPGAPAQAHDPPHHQLHPPDPPNIANIFPNRLTRQQFSDRLAWPPHVQLKHPATWQQFEHAERMFSYLAATGQAGRIHLSTAVGCPLAEVHRWEDAWRNQLAVLGELAAGPCPAL